MLKKLKQQKGETLAETLAALLIATLSVMMLTAAITASARLNSKNREADKKFAEELQMAESYGNKLSGISDAVVFDFSSADLGIENVEVELYGESDGRLVSYKSVPQEVTP